MKSSNLRQEPRELDSGPYGNELSLNRKGYHGGVRLLYTGNLQDIYKYFRTVVVLPSGTLNLHLVEQKQHVAPCVVTENQ